MISKCIPEDLYIMNDQKNNDDDQKNSSPLNSFGAVIIFMLAGAIGFGLAKDGDFEWSFMGALYGLLGLAWLILLLSTIANKPSADINPTFDNTIGRWLSLIFFTALLVFAFMEF